MNSIRSVILPRALLALAWLAFFSATVWAQVPYLLHQQGRVSVNGVNFTGTGLFRFSLGDALGSVNYWSNDGTTSGTPAASVSIPVNQGYYSLYLGDTTLPGMRALSPSVFANGAVYLRIWFDDGANGLQALGGPQRVAAVGYALMAEQVRPGAVGVDALAGVAPLWRDLLAKPDVASLRLSLGLDKVDNTSDAEKPLSAAAQSALDGKRSATLELPGLKRRLIDIGTALRAGSSTSGLFARIMIVGDSTSYDLLLPTQDRLWRQSGFGGLHLGSGISATNLNTTTLSIASDPALQARWIRGEHLRLNADGQLAFEADRWRFPSGLRPSGARVVFLTNTGSFRVRIAPYASHGDSAYNTPVWSDAATVDTAVSGRSVASVDVNFPSPGLYKVQVLTMSGAPEIVSYGFLGAGGLAIDASISSGGKALANYASTPEAVWRDYLSIAAPDLILFMFKNNGPTYNPDNLTWEAACRRMFDYFTRFAPQAEVLLVGPYNSSWDDAAGDLSEAGRRRTLLQRIAEEDGAPRRYYWNSNIWESYGAGNSLGYYQDSVHASDRGRAFMASAWTRDFGLFDPANGALTYDLPASGVSAGTYGSSGAVPKLTLASDGRVTAVETETIPFGFRKVVSLDASAASLVQPVGNADDGTLYDVTTGANDVRLAFALGPTTRKGWRVYLRKADAGTGRAAADYAFPWIGGAFSQGDINILYWDGANLQAIRMGLGSSFVADPTQGTRLRVSRGVFYGRDDNGPKDLYGTGSPEGAVAAPVGSTYRRSDGGPGSAFYVKESGTGASGWVAK